jgi:hypothetical protein
MFSFVVMKVLFELWIKEKERNSEPKVGAKNMKNMLIIA